MIWQSSVWLSKTFSKPQNWNACVRAHAHVQTACVCVLTQFCHVEQTMIGIQLLFFSTDFVRFVSLIVSFVPTHQISSVSNNNVDIIIDHICGLFLFSPSLVSHHSFNLYSYLLSKCGITQIYTRFTESEQQEMRARWERQTNQNTY